MGRFRFTNRRSCRDLKKLLRSNIGRLSFFVWKTYSPHSFVLRRQDVCILEVHSKTHVPGIWDFDEPETGPLNATLEELGLEDYKNRYAVRIFLGT
jgi:hypothetical protein